MDKNICIVKADKLYAVYFDYVLKSQTEEKDMKVFDVASHNAVKSATIYTVKQEYADKVKQLPKRFEDIPIEVIEFVGSNENLTF